MKTVVPAAPVAGFVSSSIDTLAHRESKRAIMCKRLLDGSSCPDSAMQGTNLASKPWARNRVLRPMCKYCHCLEHGN